MAIKQETPIFLEKESEGAEQALGCREWGLGWQGGVQGAQDPDPGALRNPRDAGGSQCLQVSRRAQVGQGGRGPAVR